MAIQIIGSGGASVEADSTFSALRMSLRPMQTINWQSIGAVSGNLTGVAANGPVFSFRNTGTNLMLIRRVALGFAVLTAFTTAQALTYSMIKANSFTVSDTGGTALYTAGANKFCNSMTNISSAPDIRIAAAAALGAGTRTLESRGLGLYSGSASALGAVAPISPIFAHDPEDHPLVLAQNEGFIITNLIAMGVTGVIQLQVDVEFAEVTSF